MKSSKSSKLITDTNILLLLGLALFILHMLTNHQYGFHQDEMVVVDNAYNLDWGYVEYPPITPFLTRISLNLFGLSLVSARMFAALNIYGSEYGLPKTISGFDTFWLRGYGNPPPETLIIVGLEPQYITNFFAQCTVAGTITNSYGIENDLANPPEIYVCRKARFPWPELWLKLKRYS